ncbi:ESPR-type extended signal peptide-containing protein [Stenotrophomonas sp. C3(2023)]|uniref:ESPR-type extended signal peptide-containing protein n=1 Tax=Stenotrophomonas sp. C3(2023) TaxID=3080277 RepID=UPI00293CB8FF|nr:ESPR-type extended signal peptide-containing protein [Stenotrophomonas sp. C3(2023)]MDV3468350.1 ESPR-type extended signal peptide-containing protein [Stenotrophomonas sp. C3(2023)]
MNAVYKLIFNISTGTWAVAHELAAARGKKSRTRLAAAMTIALAMPAGAALAADAPLQCGVNETISADGLRCETSASTMSPMAGGIGTMATDVQNQRYISYGGFGIPTVDTPAVASGNYTIAIGGSAEAGSAGNGYSTAVGVNSKATSSIATALGYNAKATSSATTSVGADTSASGLRATVIGYGGNASATDSVAIGANSVADVDNTVSVGNSTLQRKIVNMADGALSATSKEAVNGSQLFATNGRLTTAEGNISTLTTNVAGNTTAITNLQNGTTGLVQQDATTNNITVAASSVGGSVSLRDANSDSRILTGVRAGAARTDAVNVSQLQSTLDGIGGGQTVDATTGAVSAPTFTVGGTTVRTVGAALTNLDGRVTTVQGDITNLQTNIANGSIGLVKQDASTGEITVAGDKEGTEVSFAGVDASGAAVNRTLSGVADGTLAANSDEAVNGAQLFATNEAVAANTTDITNLDGRVTVNEGNITNLQNQIGNGSIGLVQQDATSKLITVAGDKEGTEVSFAGVDASGAAVNRTLSGVADGTLAADSDEAVNGSQLFATNEAVAANTTDITNLQGDVTNLNTSVTNLDGRVTTAETNITDLQNQIGNGSIGLVQQDATTGEITVGGDKGGTSVNFAGIDASGTAVDRTLTGVARGAADNDAANIGQVKDVVAGLGGGAAVNPDGSITAPSYSIGGTSYDNAGDAFTAVDGSLTNLDGRMTVNEGNISNLTQQFNDLSNGTAGIVTYDAVAGSVNVAAGQAGSVVNVAGTAGNRTIAGVADGDVSATSDEAVNGSQLNATNERVSANETSIANLDGRVTVNEGDISNLTQQFNDLSSGSAGMVTYDAATGSVAIGANVGGDVVNMSGTAGARRLGGVANGVADTDVATIAQLKASGLVDPNTGRALGALVYDDLSLDRATLGGTNGTVIANLGNGLIAAGSREAVNGGQLWQMNADWEAKWNQMDGRVGTIEQGIADGSIGGPGGGLPGTGGDWRGVGDGSTAIGDGAAADGTGAVGIGNGADAGGAGSVAIGDGASATGDNSVAIGKGSTADRDNEYSVGSEGNERVVSNVGRGTRPTDAVNLGQMEDRFAAERDWANGRFQAVDKRMDRMGAMNAAMVNMAVSAAGVHTTNRVGAGVGFQNGKSALSVGYQRALSDRATITLGGSFSGSEASAGFGAGFGW